MAGILSQLGCSTALKDYHNLSDNASVSPSFEIKKLIDGEIESVLIDRSNGNVIVLAGQDLWKINRQGELIDVFSYYPLDHRMSPSGIIFQQDYYIDWVFTGDRHKKKYAEHIDANSLSEAEFIAQLKRGEEVEYKRAKDDITNKSDKEISDKKSNDKPEPEALAYLRAGNRAWTMDISSRADRVSSSCRGYTEFRKLHWNATCLEGYEKPADRLYFYKPAGNVLSDVAFHRTNIARFWDSIFDTLFSPLMRGARVHSPYWYGTGFFQLKYRDEVLKFKAFADNAHGMAIPANMNFYEYANGRLMNEEDTRRSSKEYKAIYDLPSKQTQGPGIITLGPFGFQGNEMKFTDRIEKDIGLYVVRKKILINPDSAYLAQNPWHPAYSGMTSNGSIWGSIRFLDAAQPPSFYHLNNYRNPPGAPRYSPVKAVAQPLSYLPKSLSFNWAYDKREKPFKLLLDNDQAIEFASEPDEGGYDESDRAQLKLDIVFDAAEISAAFKQLESFKSSIQLLLNMEEVSAAAGRLNISLTNGQNTIALKHSQIQRAGEAGK